MSTNCTIFKDENKNDETKGFKVFETFGYNGIATVETLRALDLEIFTPYALKFPLLVKKRIRLFSRVLKGTEKIQSK